MDVAELLQVLESIKAARAALQSKTVDFRSVGDQFAAASLESMLTSLNKLEKQLIDMRKLLRATDLDRPAIEITSTNLELKQKMDIAEPLRQQYITQRNDFAQKTNVPLPHGPDN
jgi:hypothetical protein